jgi:hypothetical protein
LRPLFMDFGSDGRGRGWPKKMNQSKLLWRH